MTSGAQPLSQPISDDSGTFEVLYAAFLVQVLYGIGRSGMGGQAWEPPDAGS